MKTLQFAKWKTTKMSKPAHCLPHIRYIYTLILTKYVKFHLRRNSMKWINYLLRRRLHMKKDIVHIYNLKNKLLATPVINRIMHVMILVSRDQTVTTCMFSIILLPISLLWFSIFWLHKFLFRRETYMDSMLL